MSFPKMTEAELSEIEARCAAATGAPWQSWIEGRDHLSGQNVITTKGEDLYFSDAGAADQDFVAAARQDVPNLVTEVRRLRALLTKLGGVEP